MSDGGRPLVISSDKKTGLSIGAAGFVLQVVGICGLPFVPDRYDGDEFEVLRKSLAIGAVIGTFLLILGLRWYARVKGRNEGVFCLLARYRSSGQSSDLALSPA
jgi:hypothetical protein